MLGLATAALAFSAAPGLRPRAAVVRAPVVPQMGVMDFVNGVKVSCCRPLFFGSFQSTPNHFFLFETQSHPSRFPRPQDSVIPDNTDETLRNAFGYQALGMGAAGLLAPGWCHAKVLGVTATATSTLFLQGIALSNLAMAGRFTRGSDADAATSGLLLFGLWWKVLRDAGAVFGGYIPQIITWNMIMSIVSARRRGGLWSSLTNADTDLLSGLLPRDYDTSLRNVVGGQILAWGVMGMFFPAFLASLIGFGVTPLISALGLGCAASNLVLGGRVLGGSDDDAAANGVVFFGGWAALTYLAKGAAVINGANLNLLILWNAAVAGYCAYKMTQ